MSDLTFKTLFFRHYDRTIADGTITFSKLGMSKSDFTKLCTEPDFVPSRETVELISERMQLTDEQKAEMLAAAGYSK